MICPTLQLPKESSQNLRPLFLNHFKDKLRERRQDEKAEQEIGDRESDELEGLFGMIHGPISNCPFKNVLSQIHLIIERILEIINSDTLLQNTGTFHFNIHTKPLLKCTNMTSEHLSKTAFKKTI